jgi:predicted dehydrogenase
MHLGAEVVMAETTSSATTVRAIAAFARGEELDRRPTPAQPDRFGIGIVGSGDIVANAHIPGYRNGRYRIVGITSRNVDNARAVAERRAIDRVYGSLQELLDDPDVDVVDVAVPADVQPSIVRRVVESGKHVLAQKPLAVSYREAVNVVEAAEKAGVVLAVNQNGRFDPSINAARTLIQDGILGTRLVAAISMHIETIWQSYLRDPKYSRLMILNMSIHHIDQLRWLFGDPSGVTAFARRTPGEFFGETIAQYVLHYDDDFWATSLDDGTNWSSDFSITYRIQGTGASLKGEIGFPHGRHSTLSIQRRGEEHWETPSFIRQWFPDAFCATMGELLQALEEGRAPSNSGQDNLGTMRAVLAAYKSIDEQRRVALDEITPDRD